MNQVTHLTPLSDTIFINTNKELGKGSTGTVYQGIYQSNQTEKPKSIAIKVINMNTITNEVTNYLLHCQVASLKTLAKTKNPYIVHLYDVIYKDHIIYIVMERLIGKTLRDFLNQHKENLNQETAKQIFQKIVQGYSSLSDNKIIHRDLKPENIIFRSDNVLEPCIIDFGYSINPKVKEVPKVFYNVGSPRYMAPEAYRKNIYTQKSDVWALGIIFYEMLIGKNFDEGMEISKCHERIARDGIPYPHGFNPQLMQFLNNALNINIVNRFGFQELRQSIYNDYCIQSLKSLPKQKNQLKNQHNTRPRTEKKYQSFSPIFKKRMNLTPQKPKQIKEILSHRKSFPNNNNSHFLNSQPFKKNQYNQLENQVNRTKLENQKNQPKHLGQKIKQLVHKEKNQEPNHYHFHINKLNQVHHDHQQIQILKHQGKIIMTQMKKAEEHQPSKINVKFIHAPQNLPNKIENQHINTTNFHTPRVNFNLIDNNSEQKIMNNNLTHINNVETHVHEPQILLEASKKIDFEKPHQKSKNEQQHKTKNGIYFTFQNHAIQNQEPTIPYFKKEKNFIPEKQSNRFRKYSVPGYIVNQQKQNSIYEDRLGYTKSSIPNVHFISNNHESKFVPQMHNARQFHPQKLFVSFN